MGLFKKERDWGEMHAYLTDSFTNVKKDTTTLFEWIQFLHQKLEHQGHTIAALHTQLSNSLLTPKDIKELFDDHFAIKNTQQLHRRLHAISQKVDILAALHDNHNTRLNELHSRIENISSSTEKRSTSLKEKLIKKLTRNSKTYVKNVILGYIEKYQEVSALQLKEMLVEEQQLCSKSSFYRLLQELEEYDKIAVVKEGKQKIYLTKNAKAKMS